MQKDYYEVLGLSRDANEKDIKKAFRALAREIHPDVNRHDPEAEARFKEAAEAYEVLSNPESRSTYDRFGFDGLKRGGFQDFSQFSFEDIIKSFFGNSIFGEEVFGGGRAAARGEDLAVDVVLTLEEAATGVTRDIEYEAVGPCEACEGTGAEPGTTRDTCDACGGAGQTQTVTRTAFGQFMHSGVCAQCRGAGSVVENPCEECDGSGRTVVTNTVEVEIPAGIADGQSVRMTGRGGYGPLGATPGDLYVAVTVEPHASLTRDHDNLIYHLTMTMIEAAVGTRENIPTLEGEEEIEVKPGAQFGDVITLKGKGMPSLRGRGRGDIKVIVDVVIPKNLSTEQKKLLQDFAETTNEKNYAQGNGSLFSRIKSAFR